MKKLIRPQKLTKQQGKKYQKIRKKIEKEFPKLEQKLVQIDVCQRISDFWIDEQGGHRPKYHAQIKNRSEIWGCGKSSYEAIGNLVSNHPEKFGIDIRFLARRLAR